MRSNYSSFFIYCKNQERWSLEKHFNKNFENFLILNENKRRLQLLLQSKVHIHILRK